MLNRIAVVLGVVLFVAGCRTVEPPPPPEAPRISSFTASKARIASGEEVTLSFSTTNATKVEIFDDQGRSVHVEGEVAAGTARVGPTRTAFYILRATGAGGRDTAFVQIAVNEALRELFLIAVPAVVDSGQQAELLWGAPGASSATLTTGGAAPQSLMGTTGVVTVTPAFTEQYTLTALGAPGTPSLTAIARVEVRPVLRDATFAAETGVKAGESLRFTWSTAGASRVSISERTFGQLHLETDATAVATGSYDYVLPTVLPNGVLVGEGLPLRFTISASGGETTVSRTFDAVVGELPSIDFLDAPEFVGVSANVTIRWRTTNATKVTVLVGGLPVFSTLPTEQARVAEGSLSLPAPSAVTEYTLLATNDRGARVQRLVTVRPVLPPTIGTFTITPGTVNALGDAVTARWTTTNSERVLLRFENGPTLAVIEQPNQVLSGNIALTLATAGRVTLEAYNSADEMVSQTRAVRFSTPAASVTPELALRGTPATLGWTFATAGVIEVVGLPASQADGGIVLAPVSSSANFLDLSAVPSAQELDIVDPATGTATFTAPAGFRFPLFGVLHSSLTVGVDGIATFGTALPTGPNVNLATASSPASLLAPFWDDLSLRTGSKVLYGLRQSALGERILVIQWDDVQLASDANSSLTFQIQLFETGQIAFVYETMTGTLDSATIGLTQKSEGIVQQYAFNTSALVPSSGLELAFFSGLPADGSRPFISAVSRSYEFFGRTSTGLIPAATAQRVFGTGDVSVSEAMAFPEVTVATTGQWIELRNNGAQAVDFEGLVIASSGSSPDGGYLIPSGTIVDAGAFIVLGQSTAAIENGGAPVAQVLADVPLAAADTVTVALDGVVLGSLSWDAGVSGISNQARERVLLADAGVFACPRVTTFGDGGAVGTPGSRNETCADYTVAPMSGGFVPVPGNATVLSSLDDDDDYTTVTLAAPFPYYGTPRTSIGVSTNGFITVGSTLSSSYAANNTNPATSQPNGVVSPFWDDLVQTASGRLAHWRAFDRTIVSWEGYYLYNSSSSSAATDTLVNAQVHLVDNGSIEFHYGTMTASLASMADRVTGSGATVWVERPDGTSAVVWSVEQANSIFPNFGLRFTPNQP